MTATPNGHHTSQGASAMTIYCAEELKRCLLSLLDRFTEIDLDLSAVSDIDSAGLQLLIMAKKTAAVRGSTFRLINHSQAVIDALTLCGLDTFFADPILIRSPNS